MVIQASTEKESHLRYWESNIENWSRLYYSVSHGEERLLAPRWFSRLYSHTIGRYESHLMKRRYLLTMDYVADLEPGSHLLDVGCGTGIFTVQALLRGCRVTAVDFAESALNATRSAAERTCPGALDRLALLKLDVRENAFPPADHALLMGLLPYVEDPDHLMDEVLRATGTLCMQFSDAQHWANRIRTAIPFLNVRRLRFHLPAVFLHKLDTHGWSLVCSTKFASGHILIAKKGEIT